MLLKNEVALMRGDPKTTPKVVSSISFEAIANNSALMKHFVHLIHLHFGTARNLPKLEMDKRLDQNHSFQQENNFFLYSETKKRIYVKNNGNIA